MFSSFYGQSQYKTGSGQLIPDTDTVIRRSAYTACRSPKPAPDGREWGELNIKPRSKKGYQVIRYFLYFVLLSVNHNISATRNIRVVSFFLFNMLGNHVGYGKRTCCVCKYIKITSLGLKAEPIIGIIYVCIYTQKKNYKKKTVKLLRVPWLSG